MKIKAFIFDLDGVLVHTDMFHYEAWKKIADGIDTYFDQDINNRLRGVSRLKSLEIILEHYKGPEFSYDEKEKLASRKNEIYRDLLNEMVPAMVNPEVLNTLEDLKGRGYKLAIGSSSQNAKFILERVGLFQMFDAISDGTNITRSKPDPEVFMKAAEYLGVMPEECVVVEDAIVGIDAAIAANMISVAIGNATYHQSKNYALQEFSDLMNIKAFSSSC